MSFNHILCISFLLFSAILSSNSCMCINGEENHEDGTPLDHAPNAIAYQHQTELQAAAAGATHTQSGVAAVASTAAADDDIVTDSESDSMGDTVIDDTDAAKVEDKVYNMHDKVERNLYNVRRVVELDRSIASFLEGRDWTLIC
jgi:hypothetical protein